MRHTNGHAKRDADADSHRDGGHHADANCGSDTGLDRDTDRYGDPDSDRNRHSYCDRDGDSHRDGDSLRDANCDARARRTVNLACNFEIRGTETRYHESSPDFESDQRRRSNGLNPRDVYCG